MFGKQDHMILCIFVSNRLLWWLRCERICLQCRRARFDTWVGKIPWRREWQPIPVCLPGEFHAQRSLVGDSPWSRKESDTTEPLTETSNTIWSKTLRYICVSLFGQRPCVIYVFPFLAVASPCWSNFSFCVPWQAAGLSTHYRSPEAQILTFPTTSMISECRHVFQVQFWPSVLVNLYGHNNRKDWVAETTEIYFLTVLEVRSQR